ncbi:isoprenyl transferase [Virgibacillus xinjiangensis]|uniref:Isoprenyl transferase n=1 Tax=Virgibacillus xinjiangensis TaxID=393090 RepID=A0ABV7CV90_9BACI
MSMKLPFFKKKQTEQSDEQDPGSTPDHVAIIMDGNGRWAKKRGLPRIAGHREGVKAINRVVRAAAQSHVKVLTLYAFSTENWKRPASEVDFLMKLPKEFLHVYLPDLMENNVRIETIGDIQALPEYTQEAVTYAKEQTKDNNGLLLNFALNYGGRFEIIQAVKKLMTDLEHSANTIDSLDEKMFSDYLFTQGLTDPDLLIRSSGEQRLSNFLLWQLAYTELWFTDTYWPDFDENTFNAALLEYQQRKRRYGGI